jgi:hypothetical protein
LSQFTEINLGEIYPLNKSTEWWCSKRLEVVSVLHRAANVMTGEYLNSIERREIEGLTQRRHAPSPPAGAFVGFRRADYSNENK